MKFSKFKPRLGLLDFYLFKEILGPFLVSIGLFFAVAAFGQLLKISDSVTGIGIAGPEILSALMYSFPPLLGILIPISGLFATLLGIGRLAGDRELVAMSASGLSPYRLCLVPLCLGVMLALCTSVATIIGEPWGVKGLREIIKRSAKKAVAEGIRVGEFQEWVPGVMFLALDKQDKQFLQVIFSDRREVNRPMLISAKSAILEQGEDADDIIFHLQEGSILLRDTRTANTRVFNFKSSLYLIEVADIVHNKVRNIASVQEKSFKDLLRELKNPYLSTPERSILTIAVQRKIAMPIATILFILLAVPLAVFKTGSARARGFLFSAGIVGAYYYIGRAAELASRNNTIDPLLAAWLPNILVFSALIILLKRFKYYAV